MAAGSLSERSVNVISDCPPEHCVTAKPSAALLRPPVRCVAVTV